MNTIALHRFCLVAVLGLAIAAGFARPVQAQATPDAQTILKGIEPLSEAAREKRLIEGAKKEGKVVWYTVDSPKSTQLLADAFSKKYPFVEVQFIRAKSRALTDRIVTETRANRYLFDVATTTTESFNTYPVEDVFALYKSPVKDRLPANMKADRWAGLFIFVRGIGYNTNLVKPADVPKTWEDLLHPRWKGKIMFDESSVQEVTTMYKKWGKEKTGAYFDKLAQSGNLQLQRGRNVIAQLLAAGEAPLGVTVYAYEMEQYMQKGAPVDWVLVDPMPGPIAIASVGRRAPNPYAAALLYDFLLGQDGQKVFASMNRVPTNPQVKSNSARVDAAMKDPKLHVAEVIDAGGTIREEIISILDDKILKVLLEKMK